MQFVLPFGRNGFPSFLYSNAEGGYESIHAFLGVIQLNGCPARLALVCLERFIPSSRI